MTSPTIKGKASVAQTAAAKAPAPTAADQTIKPINRREFLFYIWGASMALLLATSGGAIIWFALPRFKAGQFGGVFSIDPGAVPPVGAKPAENAVGRYWLANTEQGVVALSAVCTHLGCLFKWSDTNGRFECPCHGSKFTSDGTFIEGPAPRDLDRFALNIVTPSGTQSFTDGEPVNATGATEIQINTGRKLKGKAHG
ncbi:MAG TPA: Rieske 2Fe-2S domain-containing protein [Aggregatilineales bacterium]|nr:Rieske 2Fe-2S domain-containing protein [Anaerolineales bacterium]HRE49620.1 Rieske 2Fe-2S domain-containing protein [Aggregatilineales bacterium]